MYQRRFTIKSFHNMLFKHGQCTKNTYWSNYKNFKIKLYNHKSKTIWPASRRFTKIDLNPRLQANFTKIYADPRSSAFSNCLNCPNSHSADSVGHCKLRWSHHWVLYLELIHQHVLFNFHLFCCLFLSNGDIFLIRFAELKSTDVKFDDWDIV